MGASNALAAYRRYAGNDKVTPLSMQCLIFMALVSKDDDERPWYGQGHAALAEHALGRPDPSDSDLRAVRRAITPLLQEKAIEVDRPASGRRDGPMTVRYRLNLQAFVGQKPSDDTPAEPAFRRTETVRSVGRKVTDRRTKSVPAQDENRPPKEEEDHEERGEEQGAGFSTEFQTAREANAQPEEAILGGKPRASTCSCGTYLDPDGSCFLCRTPARAAS